MEKRTLQPAWFLIAALLCSGCMSTEPEWYAETAQEPGFYAGSGTGDTQDDARAHALRSLAEQLKIRVTSSLSLSEKGNEAESSLLFEQKIDTATDLVLTGAEKIKEEKRGNRWYVLYRYDNRPLRVRVADALSPGKSPPVPSERSDGFDDLLPFAHFLKDNGHPSDFLLSHKNGLWLVSVGNLSFPVSNQELAADFLSAGRNDNLILKPGMLNSSPVYGQPADSLREGQNYSIEINPETAGYITLFYVDNNGAVQCLMANEPATEGNTVTFPDPGEYPHGLIAETAAGVTHSTDMILALYTDIPSERFSWYTQVSEQSAAGDGLYTYGRLLNDVRDMEIMNWSARIIRVERGRPK